MAERKPLTFVEHLTLAQRLAKSGQYRSDVSLAIREFGEAISEIVAALLEREQARESSSQ